MSSWNTTANDIFAHASEIDDEAERQALALMDHPNVAKVFEAGATEDGRPYFVMELVRGVTITDFWDKNELPNRERLKLFRSVCNAVHHAHQKGVIHRDIKPSNVMITLQIGPGNKLNSRDWWPTRSEIKRRAWPRPCVRCRPKTD